MTTSPAPDESALHLAGDSDSALRREYQTTLSVLAVVTERLLAVTKADHLEIDDAAILMCADLEAFRDPHRYSLILRVSR